MKDIQEDYTMTQSEAKALSDTTKRNKAKIPVRLCPPKMTIDTTATGKWYVYFGKNFYLTNEGLKLDWNYNREELFYFQTRKAAREAKARYLADWKLLNWRNKDGWIKVTDMLPDGDCSVLGTAIGYDNTYVSVFEYSTVTKHFYDDFDMWRDVIAWQPLPAPYKEP